MGIRRWVLSFLLFLSLTTTAYARTWHVESDGSGDFTEIQDALDAASSGDSVLVGPGRYGTFRPARSVADGTPFQTIVWMTKPGIDLIGSGVGVSFIGPATLVSELDGLRTTGLYLDPPAEGTISGFTFDNVQFPVNIRYRCVLEDCAIVSNGRSFGVVLISGEDVLVRRCTFTDEDGILTGGLVHRAVIEDCTFEDVVGGGSFAVAIANGATE